MTHPLPSAIGLQKYNIGTAGYVFSSRNRTEVDIDVVCCSCDIYLERNSLEERKADALVGSLLLEKASKASSYIYIVDRGSRN